MPIQFQDYGGDYVKRFDDANPETFSWVTRDSVEFLAWLDSGNALIPPPTPVVTPPEETQPVIVVDEAFLSEITDANNINALKKAILDAADRAKNRNKHER